MIDSPGLLENNHELVLALVSGQTRTPAEISNIVVRTTPAGVPVRIGDIANVHAVGDAGLYDRDRERKARGAAESFPAARQQYGRGGRRGDAELDADPQDAAAGVKLQTFYDQSTLVRDSIAACATPF
jgi:Cu/Ag efflux pump CusA